MSLQNLNDVADIRKEYPKLSTTLLNISDMHIFLIIEKMFLQVIYIHYEQLMVQKDCLDHQTNISKVYINRLIITNYETDFFVATIYPVLFNLCSSFSKN